MHEPASAESDWVSAHAFYHEDLDRLVTDVIAPLVTAMRADGLARTWFFLRYWEGGTHIRLRVLPAEKEKHHQVSDLIDDRFRAYFAKYPAEVSMTQEDYADFAQAAVRELPGYSTTLFPNNSVSFIPYRREYETYGTGAVMTAVEQHFLESSEIAISVVAGGASDQRRVVAGASMIALAWWCAEPDLERLFAQVADDTGRSVSTGGASEIQDAAQGEWCNLLRRMWALTATVATSRASGTLVEWARSVAALRDAVDDARQTQVFTVLDACAHLVCNRIGITIQVERDIRRRLTAAVVGEMAGEFSA